MKNTPVRRLAPIALLAAALLAFPAGANALPPIPGDTPADFPPDLVLPAGLGCPDFALGIEATGVSSKVQTFLDRNGDPVRVLTTGKGYTLTFINDDTGAEVVFRATGSNRTAVTNPDGTTSVTDRGAVGIILFPSDTPKGPSATLYHGRVEYTLTADGTNTFLSLETSGTSIDICEALS